MIGKKTFVLVVAWLSAAWFVFGVVAGLSLGYTILVNVVILVLAAFVYLKG